jgi:ADP-heptose:LPS heptosyltransferase
LLRLAGVQTIAAISEDYAGTLLTIRHGVSDSIHEVERALSIVATLGYRLPDGDDGALRMRSEPFEERSLPARYVVVHPGATVPARRWSPQSNAALVHALCARRTNVVVTGGPDEAALTRFVAGSHPRAVDLGAKTTLGQLAAILARADAIVVGNTGAAHVAAAVGCPVVSIFPPTIPVVRFAPWRVACAVLGNQQIGCAGCRARECPRGDHACVACVTVDDVLAALARVHMPPAKRSRVPGGMRLDRSAFAGGAASGAVAGP